MPVAALLAAVAVTLGPHGIGKAHFGLAKPAAVASPTQVLGPRHTNNTPLANSGTGQGEGNDGRIGWAVRDCATTIVAITSASAH